MTKKLNIKGTRAQDLQAARQELKEFRHDVAILKRKGLIDKQIYDARSVKPTKYLKSQIKKFADVIAGKATPVKVNKAKAKDYARQGYTVKNGRVVVPHLENEKVYSTHGDFRVAASGRGGKIVKINLGLDKHDLNKWIDDLRNSRYKLKSDELLMFQFYGNNSYGAYGNTPNKTAQQHMAERLEAYQSIQQLLVHGKPDQEQDVIENIVLFKVKRDPHTEDWSMPDEHPVHQEIHEETKRARAEARKRARKNRINNMGQAKYERFLNERAEQERKRREKMTPEQKAAYNQKALERTRKNRSKKNGEEK
ncbi:MAG: hypothetical protein KGL39_27530 [Patescibacteria group bacterium]|nr:hypothetical protein [Patescibacteria group bacterium]